MSNLMKKLQALVNTMSGFKTRSRLRALRAARQADEMLDESIKLRCKRHTAVVQELTDKIARYGNRMSASEAKALFSELTKELDICESLMYQLFWNRGDTQAEAKAASLRFRERIGTVQTKKAA